MSTESEIKEYNLSSLSQLEAELGSIDTEEKNLIQTLIDKLLYKSELYTKFLEDMLHPDSSIVSMQV